MVITVFCPGNKKLRNVTKTIPVEQKQSKTQI